MEAKVITMQPQINFIPMPEDRFNKLEEMFMEAMKKINDLTAENKSLKGKRMLTIGEVAERSGFSARTIRSRKDEIGFSKTYPLRISEERYNQWVEGKSHKK